MPAEVDRFMNAIAGIESGGSSDPYNVTNPDTGAHGKFQVLPSNWSPWAKEAGLGGDAPRTPQNQTRVARHKLQQYKQQFGSWDLAAAAWFAGPNRAKRIMQGDKEPLSYDDGNKTVAQYMEDVRRGMGNEPQIERTSDRSDAPGLVDDQSPPPDQQTQPDEGGQPSFEQDRTNLARTFAALSDRISREAQAGGGVGRLDENLRGQFSDAAPTEFDEDDWDRPSRQDAVDEGTVSRILEKYGHDGLAERIDQPGDVGVPAEGEPTEDAQDLPGSPGQRLLDVAKQSIGVPYKWGGNDLQAGVDCSGLIQQAAREIGIELPRVSRDQAKSGREVSLDQAQAGDLIAFPSRGYDVGHIGILSHQDDNGQWHMLHAPRSGRTVTIEPIGSRSIATVRRVVEDSTVRDGAEQPGARQAANTSGSGPSREPSLATERRRTAREAGISMPRPQRERRQRQASHGGMRAV